MFSLMYDWKWTSALLRLKNGGNKNNQKVPTEILAEISFSCLLNTGIIAPCVSWVRIPPNRVCRSGAAQWDKALTSCKRGHPSHVSLPFQHPIAPWQMQKSWHRGCCFPLQALLHHSDTCSSMIPAPVPRESKLMASTQSMFVAHTGNHGVDHGGISSDKQFLLQRY